jgi:hypothetical protein
VNSFFSFCSLLEIPGGNAGRTDDPLIWGDGNVVEAFRICVSMLSGSRIVEIRRKGDGAPQPVVAKMTLREVQEGIGHVLEQLWRGGEPSTNALGKVQAGWRDSAAGCCRCRSLGVTAAPDSGSHSFAESPCFKIVHEIQALQRDNRSKPGP